MMDKVEWLVRLLHLRPSLYGAMAVVAWTILLLSRWSHWLDFAKLTSAGLWWTFLSAVSLTALMFEGVYHNAHARRVHEREMEAIHRTSLGHLSAISEEERIVFACCLHRSQDTIRMIADHPVAVGLCCKGLLMDPGRGPLMAVPYVIPGFVWEHIRANRTTFLPSQLDNGQAAAQIEAHFQDILAMGP